MTDPHGAPRAAVPWKARALHHDAEHFLRAPGCHGCIDRAICGGLHTATRLLDCTEHCCGKPDSCDWVCRRNPRFKTYMQAIGGLSLDNIRLTGAALPVAPLPPLVPLVYHSSRRATPLEIPAAAIKLAQLFDKRTGAPRFTTRAELSRRFALSPPTTLIVSGVDKDPVIERRWAIGQPQRLAVIEAMKAMGVAIVTSPNFTLSVNWPRTGDMAAMKRIARVYAGFMNAGLPATLHAHGRADTDLKRWAALLQRLEAITWLSYEFSTGAAYGERRDRHIAWLKRLAASRLHPTHLGPLAEFAILKAQGKLGASADATVVQVTPLWPLLATQEPNTVVEFPGHAGCLRLATRSLGETELTRLSILTKRSARAAGFDDRTASQLSAAVGELLSNIIEHSEASHTGLVAFRASDACFEFVAADQGVGALASLRGNPRFAALTSDREALPLVLEHGCSCYDQSGRGTGFDDMFLGLAGHNGHLRFRSGDAAVLMDGASQVSSTGRSRRRPTSRASSSASPACLDPRGGGHSSPQRSEHWGIQ